jgi:hypothetical protein
MRIDSLKLGTMAPTMMNGLNTSQTLTMKFQIWPYYCGVTEGKGVDDEIDKIQTCGKPCK